MAKDLNNGERLLSAIIEGAEAEAVKVLAEARTRAAEAAQAAEAEAGRILAEAERKAEALRGDILDRSRTNAHLDARKYALTRNRAVIDEAFGQAAAALSALDGPEREGVLTKLLLQNAEGGESIRPASVDAAALKGLLPGINEKLAAAAKAPLTLGQVQEGLAAGFLLVAESYEINCSFEAVLRDMRSAQESGVAAILFGQGR